MASTLSLPLFTRLYCRFLYRFAGVQSFLAAPTDILTAHSSTGPALPSFTSINRCLAEIQSQQYSLHLICFLSLCSSSAILLHATLWLAPYCTFDAMFGNRCAALRIFDPLLRHLSFLFSVIYMLTRHLSLSSGPSTSKALPAASTPCSLLPSRLLPASSSATISGRSLASCFLTTSSANLWVGTWQCL